MARAAFIAMFLAALPSAGDEPKKADYYTLAKGNKWDYVAEIGDMKKEASFEVTAVKKDGDKVIADVLMTEENRTRDLKVVVSADGVQGPMFLEIPTEPLARMLKYPVKPGDTWTEKLTFREDRTMIALSTVKEVEEVKVPAGTFQAVPVVVSVQVEKEPAGFTAYYVDGVGLVQAKYHLGNNTITVKLKKFTPGT